MELAVTMSGYEGEKTMKCILITGGTVFVSRYVAEYYVKKGYQVYVLNRNNHIQSKGVTLIEGNRTTLKEQLRSYHFDVVFDLCAYTQQDVDHLLDALGSFDTYILLSSSAVYPEYEMQPFSEQTTVGDNKVWGSYGTNKIAAEKALHKRVPDAYIVRPPYLYGPKNNVYREAFVFDCALQDRPFYIPNDGNMKLQFFYIHDLCRFFDCLLDQRPSQLVFNVGNEECICVKDWVRLCYKIAGKDITFTHVSSVIEQRNYFSFYDYEYKLDVHKQMRLMSATTTLEEGLQHSFDWYVTHCEDVNKKPYLAYIDENL